MGATCEVLLALHVTSRKTVVFATLVDIDRMVGHGRLYLRLRINRDSPHNRIICNTTNVVFVAFAFPVPSHCCADTANSPTLNTLTATTHAQKMPTTLISASN